MAQFNLGRVKGDKGDQGLKGDSGISPVVTVNTDTGTTYKLDITDAEGTQTTPNLRGADGTGAGDMTSNVYDPQGKAVDIFEYADTKMSKADLVQTAQVNNIKKPIISFSYDGTYATIFTALNPIFSAEGVSATFALETGQIGQPDRLTEEQVIELQDVYNHEIASHSITHPHLSDLSLQDCEKELLDSKKMLENLGCKVSHFIYPFGDYDENVINLTRKHYESASVTLGGEIGYYNYSPINTYKLTRVGMSDSGGNRPLSYYKEMVDTAVANNTWLIFYSHATEYNNAEEKQILTDLIDYIKLINVDILTISEAHKYYKNKVDIGFRGANRFKPGTNAENDYQGGYFFIGYDGTADFYPMDMFDSVSDVVFLEADSRSATSDITKYPDQKMSIFRTTTPNSVGFPGNIGGIVTTYRLGNSYPGFKQEFRQNASNELWARHMDYNGSWKAWEKYATIADLTASAVTIENKIGTVIASANAYTAADLITTYADNKITVFRTNSTNTTGFPENSFGTVTTYRVGGNGWSRQEFRKYMTNDIWCRYVDTAGAWSPWAKVNNPKIAIQSDSVATDVETLKTDFNALLAKLKAAGLM